MVRPPAGYVDDSPKPISRREAKAELKFQLKPVSSVAADQIAMPTVVARRVPTRST
jgi:hypothetical protein